MPQVPQPCGNALRRDLQHSLDVSKLRLRQIVEIHESMLELAAARGVLDREPNFLQRHPSMIVLSKDVDARLLQGAEQTPFAASVVIVALTIVLAIPDRLIAQNLVGLCENAEVLARDRTIALLEPQPAKPSARQGDEQQTRQAHHNHECFLQAARTSRAPLTPQPPEPETGQGYPNQSDAENRAVTHTMLRRSSLESRTYRPVSAQLVMSRPLEFIRSHCRAGQSGRPTNIVLSRPDLSTAALLRREARWLSEDEEKALLEGAPAHLRPMIIGALDTGMRRGEMLAMRFCDIDETRQVLVLRGSTTKSKKTRVVPIGTARLQAVLQYQRLDAEGEAKPETAPVFSNAFGEPIHYFRTAWERALSKAGLSDLRWHDLRHEYASRLAERGVPLSQVRDLLGHASIMTTERYDTQTLAALQSAARVLEDGKTFQNFSSSDVSAKKPADKIHDEKRDNSLEEIDLEVGGPPGDRTRDTVIKSPFPRLSS